MSAKPTEKSVATASPRPLLPGTINETNYSNAFFSAHGAPAAPLIVEGANLYATPGAREALHRDSGVRIVQDFSANKGGVICSSFEILAAHLMDASEFEANKPTIVSDVVDSLRSLAAKEAHLLFREHARSRGALPEFSARASAAVNRVADAVVAELANSPNAAAELYASLAPDHLPASRCADGVYLWIVRPFPTEAARLLFG